MNPNREHIDDEVTVEEDVLVTARRWLTAPPRRARRDVIFAPVAVAVAVGWFAFIFATADTRAFPSGGVVLAGLAWAIAEALPERAVRPALLLRTAGTVLFVAGMALALATPIFDSRW